MSQDEQCFPLHCRETWGRGKENTQAMPSLRYMTHVLQEWGTAHNGQHRKRWTPEVIFLIQKNYFSFTWMIMDDDGDFFL